MNTYNNSLAHAQQLDKEDGLSAFRASFIIPKKDNKEVVYLCGNSLGLQPKSTSEKIATELSDWANLGVEAHFKGTNPWASYHHQLSPSLAKIIGAKNTEVVAMNSLTTNLHIMLATFYKPNAKRFKIITEAKSFSSDIYALESQVQLHGLNPDTTIIELASNSEGILEEDTILKAIAEHSNELALVLLGGVNFYTGQCLDMLRIAQASHEAGAIVGFDLAHAIGNVPLALHEWNVDFAVWCTYKYLNSGPGGVGGLFVHERHSNPSELVRPAGWWGNRAEDRFQMNRTFQPSTGADGFQLSNEPILSMAAHKAALELFDQAGIDNIVQKSIQLTGFLEFLIHANCTNNQAPYKIKIITPKDAKRRGAQLSIQVEDNCKELFDIIYSNGFVIDMRAPYVLRITPAPLYNSFTEVFHLVELLKSYCYLTNK